MFQFRLSTRFFLFGLALTSLCTLSAACEESLEESQHAACRRCEPTRQMTPEREAKVYKKIAQFAAKTKCAFESARINKDLVKTMETRGLCGSERILSFQQAPHFLQDLSPRGDIVTIENGAGWSVAEKDQYIARRWLINIPLTITPNKLSIWGSLLRKELKYKYRVVNLQTGEEVQANLSQGPFAHNPATHYVRRINVYTREIILTNGTIWKIEDSSLSNAIFKEWQENDAVITGTNNTWFGTGYSQILINVNCDNWLPAYRLY